MGQQLARVGVYWSAIMRVSVQLTIKCNFMYQ